MNSVEPASTNEATKLEYLEALEQRAYLQENLPHLYGWKWYPWARKFYDSTNRYNFLVAANQISKALNKSCLVQTPSGWRQVGEIEVGDRLFSWDGSQTKVIGIPFDGEAECYKFIFDDDSEVISSDEHIWWAKGYEERFRKTYKNRRAGSSAYGQIFENKTYGVWKQFSTKEILASGGYSPTTSAPKRFSFPIAEPVDFPEAAVFDPYFMGLFLGDGCSTNGPSLCNPEPEIAAYLLSHGATARVSVNHCPVFGVGVIRGHLITHGLDGCLAADKFIPTVYIQSSIEQRKALLAGLMDTDGCAHKDGVYSYTTVSKRLAADFRELVASLGGKTRSVWRNAYYVKDGQRVECQDACTIYVLTTFNPFRLPRKAARWHPIRYKHERVLREIIPMGKMPCRCFTVAAADGSFLATKDYLVTHNSSTQIRKCIDWATDASKWKKLWKTTPRQFWYFYPDFHVATVEFDEKWVKEFLPRGKLRDHPIYGWTVTRGNKRQIDGLHFNSGVSVYFKSYEQKGSALQTASVHAIFGDEEMPVEVFDEVNMRIASPAIEGYFHLVFTATLGLEFWWQTMEEKGERERFPKAFKQQISMYDCLKYDDGTESLWTVEKIKEIENSCKSQAEILRRVYGRFVVSDDLKYPAFDEARNVAPDHPLPKSWSTYVGVDPGSGGKAHPAAITFLGVNPEMTEGRIFRCWRGDGMITTSSDIVEQYMRIRGDVIPVIQVYDHAARDFMLVAGRVGIPFMPANKDNEYGERLLNTLFKTGMLKIYEGYEQRKLVWELKNTKSGADKSKAKDDLIDSMRFAVCAVPWDFSKIAAKFDKPIITKEKSSEQKRMDFYSGADKPVNDGLDLLQSEFDEANELMDYDHGDPL